MKTEGYIESRLIVQGVYMVEEIPQRGSRVYMEGETPVQQCTSWVFVQLSDAWKAGGNAMKTACSGASRERNVCRGKGAIPGRGWGAGEATGGEFLTGEVTDGGNTGQEAVGQEGTGSTDRRLTEHT